MEQLQVIFDLLRMVRRRFLIIASLSMLGVMATLFLAYILPPVYQAQARILVESQQIPTELARSTVTASAQERLQVIQQRLMARDNLVELIGKHGLFADRPDLSPTEKIQRLREATAIVPTTGAGVLAGVMIQVTLNNPVQVAAVANDFSEIVLSQNARVRTERAAETLGFFRREETRLAKAVTAVEKEITDFKRDNKDALPESLDFRHDELSRLAETDLELDRRILEIEETRGELEARLSQLRLETTTPEESPARQQLRELELRLTQLRAVYSESHREIQALKPQIAALKISLPDEEPTTGADIRAIQEAALGRQIALLDDQITLLREQKAGLVTREATLEETIRRTPDIEVTLNALERRLADLQDQLSAIVLKRAEAETGEKLEVNQQAERFELVESALMPERPVSPNRKKIAIMGSAASLAMAFGFAFLLELLRPAIRTAGQMQRQLDLRPVVSIPHIRTRGEQRWRFARATLILALIGGGIPAMLFGIDQHVMPLQLIGQKLADKTGIAEFVRMIEARL